jgi:hypothetical protein
MEMSRKWWSALRLVITNSKLRHVVMRCRRSSKEVVKTMLSMKSSVSASSPLVDFGELNDNTIKGLTSLLSIE